MSKKAIWEKQDNTMEPEKIELRKRYLPKDAVVLDLFCGNGNMYKGAYENRVDYYHGVDKGKVHDKQICTLMDNEQFIIKHSIDKYNVFDLDAYGSPWKLLYLICCKLISKKEITIFVTDGLVIHQKMTGKVSKFVSATESIPRKMNLPGINRFYVDVFGTMLKDIEQRYEWKTRKAAYFHNSRRTVYYWALKMTKCLD